MAEARQRQDWSHTAQLLAMTYNAHRGKGARAMKPDEFNPLAVQRKQQQPVATNDLSVLKRTFVDR